MMRSLLLLRLCRRIQRAHSHRAFVLFGCDPAVPNTLKPAGVAVSVETCPHYLTFAAEDIPDGATEFKCAPPIRERENREQLWQALRDGTIDHDRHRSFSLPRRK